MIKTDLLSLAVLLFVGVAARPAAAQSAGDIPPPVLSQRDISSLQKQLQSWWQYELEITDLRNEVRRTGNRSGSMQKKIRSLSRKAGRAKDKFRDAFEKKGEKVGGLEKHLGDLIAIWDDCFEYPSVMNGGRVSKQWVDKRRKHGPFGWRFPRSYRPNHRWPLVFSLPNRITTKTGKEKWNPGGDYIEQAWPAAERGGYGDQYVFACPTLPDDMDLTASVDPTKEIPATEKERISTVFGVLGHVVTTLKIDSDRVYLEACGKSTPFALRLASTFPDRFAGLILKNPEETTEAIPDNLRNIAIAILYDKSGADRAKVFSERLKANQHHNVYLKEVKDGKPPFGETAADLVTWMSKVKRNLFVHDFVLTPVYDRFKKAYWVDILAADAIADTGLEYRPRLEVKVDRAANRIEVNARRISEVRFHLNDAIVDLDKPITFVLNGKSQEEKRQRSVRYFENPETSLIVLRNEPRAIFVARGQYKIPKAEAPEDKVGNGQSGGTGPADNGGKGK